MARLSALGERDKDRNRERDEEQGQGAAEQPLVKQTVSEREVGILEHQLHATQAKVAAAERRKHEVLDSNNRLMEYSKTLEKYKNNRK